MGALADPARAFGYFTFVAGTCVLGTWLVPPLVAAGVWRHLVHRIPLRYEAAMWSVVFPLGMYGVGGHFLGQADHLPIVEAIVTDA